MKKNQYKRERERERERERGREREREYFYVCVCVCERERETYRERDRDNGDKEGYKKEKLRTNSINIEKRNVRKPWQKKKKKFPSPFFPLFYCFGFER